MWEHSCPLPLSSECSRKVLHLCLAIRRKPSPSCVSIWGILNYSPQPYLFSSLVILASSYLVANPSVCFPQYFQPCCVNPEISASILTQIFVFYLTPLQWVLRIKLRLARLCNGSISLAYFFFLFWSHWWLHDSIHAIKWHRYNICCTSINLLALILVY